ncbi:MAG: deoxyribose-phosphate aldolase [Glaciecola sp.]|jgi:deoxyribose-phosphate aldolase|uniref:deoxyribose-phosphate aldolase n=1 Tax=Congregibacter sp. TaxID=2744308 RepID=UPI0039E466FB
MDSNSYDDAAIAAAIDHTLLKPEARAVDIDQVCEEALEHQFAAVCVNSLWVPRVAAMLKGSSVKTCSVVGFPLGASLPAATAAEARLAIDAGASEIDMVMSIGDALAGDWDRVRDGIAEVLASCADIPLKVILETCLLAESHKRLACEICGELGVAFVKTSTGFSTSGATVDDVALMRGIVGSNVGVKASGGIRDRDTAVAMLAAGANRLGCSAGVAIVTGGEGAEAY